MEFIKIGIDLDGVVADFTSEFAQILREYFKIKLPENYMPSDWGWSEIGMTPKLMDQAWEIIDSTNNFWETLKPLDDIVALADFFHEHQDKNCDIYFITARKDGAGDSVRVQSERWLRNYLGDPKQNIIVLPVKSGVDKVDIIHAMQIAYSIDDHTPTVASNKSLHRHNAYLMNRPWNQDGKAYNLRIVNSLTEFFEEIE